MWASLTPDGPLMESLTLSTHIHRDRILTMVLIIMHGFYRHVPPCLGFLVVHNGIITNYKDIKQFLVSTRFTMYYCVLILRLLHTIIVRRKEVSVLSQTQTQRSSQSL